jgi:hypothetical protein
MFLQLQCGIVNGDNILAAVSCLSNEVHIVTLNDKKGNVGLNLLLTLGVIRLKFSWWWQ